MTETVMRMEVGVCWVASAAIFRFVPPLLFFTMVAREFAWFIYW